ncbi:hypothetical protein PACTADRAFT_46341 [Pachysolen tannophilus NRRL Y-2460]|uniref:High osmolarity signaling protein SHO1 n=1 Tax=Pachysolen tannophilus NRRL Y-2460 TaxID=669874 RepID=A0A1E4TN50_PACTA|nr:hypothetical protein PACTADRAFT_46341 [Pachysolen tannophilus NRRL Y-2460]
MFLSNLIRDPFAVGTLSISSIAWLITFIGAIVSNAEDSFPKFSWWGLMFQLVLNISLIILYFTETIEYYKQLICGALSIAFVYSTNSSNYLVYSTSSSKAAAAAGCILLSMINIIWLLYFGGDSNSPTNQWIDSFALRGNNIKVAHTSSYDNPDANRKEANQMNGVGNYGVNPFGYNNTNQNAPYMASSTQLNGLENGEEPANFNDTTVTGDEDHEDHEEEEDEDLESNSVDNYPYTVKALYNYDANPEDINEISFTKGDVLKVKDIKGRWWEAKKESGDVGILPSNYVEIIS